MLLLYPYQIDIHINIIKYLGLIGGPSVCAITFSWSPSTLKNQSAITLDAFFLLFYAASVFGVEGLGRALTFLFRVNLCW